MMSSKSRKRDEKIERKISVFPIPLVTILGQSGPEMQSETRGVQSFGAKSGARAFERAINCLSDLNSLEDIAV